MGYELKKQLKSLVSVVGLPNAGKSTLFNRLIGERKSIVTDIAGTTRDSVLGRVNWQGDSFWLIDTAGIRAEKELGEMEIQIEEQVLLSIEDAEIILWVVDVSKDSVDRDLAVVKKYRKYLDKIVLLLNKTDKKSRNIDCWEYEKFGVSKIFDVSGRTGAGLGDVLDYAVGYLHEKEKLYENKKLGGNFTVSIIGRPNVGKSSMVNRICGREKRIVSEVSGTTRDIGEVTVRYGSLDFELLDTAGIRRMGKVHRKYIERFSIMRALMAMSKSDLVIMMLDAEEGLTHRDMALIGKVDQMKKGLILFVNKWDLIAEVDREKKMKRMIDNLRQKINFIYWVPVVFGSAKTGLNIKPLLDNIRKIKKGYYFEAPLGSMEDLGWELQTKNKRMSSMGIKKIEQVSSGPPMFKIDINNKKIFSSNDEKMLEDIVRDYFGLRGVAIKIKLA